MSFVALAIADLARPVGTPALPRLPALERLLARGARHAAPADFRRWVLACAGVAPPARLPMADVVAGRPGHWLLASPVHLVAGLERVHMHPAGVPMPAPGELEAIAASFNASLGGGGLALEVAAPAVALLSLPRPVSAHTHDPALLAGLEAGAWLPDGPDGGWLRRLMTEAQMLLHDHPVNRAREARGEPAINGLWLWGGGGDALPSLPRDLPALVSGDAFLCALWRRAGGVVARPGAGPVEGRDRAQIVTLEMCALGAAPSEALERAETCWFGPLEHKLARGGIARLDLYLAGCAVRCAPRDRMRVWRRRRPWHEALA